MIATTCRTLQVLLLLAVAGGAQAAEFPLPAPYAEHAAAVDVADYRARAVMRGVRLWWDGEQFSDADGNRYSPPAWFVAGFPAATMDGLMRTEHLDNNAIERILRAPQAEEGWRKLFFVALDLPEANGGFDARQAQLEQQVNTARLPHLGVAQWTTFADSEQLQAALEAMYRAGGDGYILKRSTADYDADEDAHLLVLPYEVGEATVVAHRPGKGEFSGMMGSMEVADRNGGLFIIGSGFTHALRRNPPPLNARVAFKYKGFTGTGKPKNPVFLHIINAAAEEKKIGGILRAVHVSWIFIVLMGVLALMDAVTHRPGGRRWNFKSAIVSTGLLGTFVGVFWGLYNFDTADIAAGVPTLLEGLKLAFVTSIVGVALSTLLSVAQTILGSGD